MGMPARWPRATAGPPSVLAGMLAGVSDELTYQTLAGALAHAVRERVKDDAAFNTDFKICSVNFVRTWPHELDTFSFML